LNPLPRPGALKQEKPPVNSGRMNRNALANLGFPNHPRPEARPITVGDEDIGTTKMRLTFLLIAAVWALPEMARGALPNQLPERIVQTLSDTQAGIKSNGLRYRWLKNAASYRSDNFGVSRTYAVGADPGHHPQQAIYRITEGADDLRLLVQPWQKMRSEGRDGDPEAWSRQVMVGTGRFHEILARRRIDAINFELLFTFPEADRDQGVIFDRFRLLLDNAARNGLISRPNVKVERPIELQFFGTWEGPMSNSRGERSASSLLILRPGAGDKVGGAWHAGWKFEDGRLKQRTLTWHHLNIEDCRDYTNNLEIAPGGETAVLNYTVDDRCRTPKRYTGTANLKKVASWPEEQQ
jgi:hypothetical protein